MRIPKRKCIHKKHEGLKMIKSYQHNWYSKW